MFRGATFEWPHAYVYAECPGVLLSFRLMSDMTAVNSEVLVEAKANGSNEVILTIISAGWGNEAHNHYYPAEVLEEAATNGVFSGVRMFADHLTRKQQQDLGGMPRSVRDVVGRIKETWYDAGSQSIKGRAKLVPWFYELVSHDPELIEASINAKGRAKTKQIEGRTGRFVEAIARALSVDWVVEGGAGGKVDELLEAHMEEIDNMLDDLTVDQLVETRPDLIKDILEGPLNERANTSESDDELAESETVEVETPAAETPAQDEVVTLTEAQVDERVEIRARSIADEAIAAYELRRAKEDLRDSLVEAATLLPSKTRESLKAEFKDVTQFDGTESLIEAVKARIEDRTEEIREALSNEPIVRGLGPSIPANTKSGASKTRGGYNDLIEGRMELDSAESTEETVA